MGYKRPDLVVTDVGPQILTDALSSRLVAFNPSRALGHRTGLLSENAMVTFRWHNKERDRHTSHNVVLSYIRVDDCTCIVVAKRTIQVSRLGTRDA
jgi:hypothetical protein